MPVPILATGQIFHLLQGYANADVMIIYLSAQKEIQFNQAVQNSDVYSIQGEACQL